MLAGSFFAVQRQTIPNMTLYRTTHPHSNAMPKLTLTTTILLTLLPLIVAQPTTSIYTSNPTSPTLTPQLNTTNHHPCKCGILPGYFCGSRSAAAPASLVSGDCIAKGLYYCDDASVKKRGDAVFLGECARFCLADAPGSDHCLG